jgi:ribosome-associated protein
MDIRKLQRAIVDGLEDVKAQNIVVFNTEHLSPLFERVIIASGTSNRQTKSLASSVRDAVKESGFPVLRTEGEANGEWIIVDCGAAVVHVMQPSIRDYYHLEEIWGDKPVNMKLNVGALKLVKAAEPEPAGRARPTGVTKTAATKSAAPRTAAKKASAAKTPAKIPAKTTGVKTAARKAPTAKKAAPQRAGAAGSAAVAKASSRQRPAPAGARVVTRVVGVKRASPGTAAAKKAPAKRAPVSKPAPAKPAARKPAARKSPTRP